MNKHSGRYDRQTILPEIGLSGQEKLANAKVLIIGAGGLGCPVLQNLAAAGVGHIGIVDGDAIEKTNLHRQFLYTPADCGKNKALVAVSMVLKQNPEVDVVGFNHYFTKSNAAEIARDYQIIVDCCDNIATRYLINDIAVAKGIPMVYASIHKFEGQLSVLNYKGGPSYRCLFPQTENLIIADCKTSGVLGVLPNTLGVMQANETLKIILEKGKVLSGNLFLYDGLNNTFQTIGFQKNETEIQKGILNGSAILSTNFKKPVTAINALAFFEAAEKNDALIIDIRESYEEPKMTISNILNIPLSQLDNHFKDVARNHQIILCCQHGNNSLMASDYLFKKGFTNVSHLENGIESLNEKYTAIND
jgi:molybdopterin/thiamine biosynthesis adenylyltransferase/rhodanese-related sulfurtransferase